MNKQALMTKAHKIAKSIVSAVGNYMVAMKIALKQAWSEMMNTFQTEHAKTLDALITEKNSEFVEMFRNRCLRKGRSVEETEQHIAEINNEAARMQTAIKELDEKAPQLIHWIKQKHILSDDLEMVEALVDRALGRA